MLSRLVKALRDIVFVWGTLVAVSVWLLSYYEECEDCLFYYRVEIGLGALTIVTSAIIWFAMKVRVSIVELKAEKIEAKVDEGISEIQVTLIKSDVDRYFKEHRNSEELTEDEMKYVYMLEEKMHKYGINSFTQRKIDYLKSKRVG